MNKNFVTVFPGRRDHYEVPVALNEAGLLDAFITDLYNDNRFLSQFLRITSFKSKIKQRFHSKLPKSKVQTKPYLFFYHSILSNFFQPSKVTVWQDDLFGKLAVKLARKNKSNLFLYEFQADYAFRQQFKHPCKKVLFYFHTHPFWEHPLLLEDAEKYPSFHHQVLKNTRSNLAFRYSNHTKDAWKFADIIITASSCTKKSLLAVGADEKKIKVVPYGFSNLDITLSKQMLNLKPSKPFFLFVGSGTQRKGLHHLCEAWKKSSLTQSHELIVVSRVMDEGMMDFIKLDTSIKLFTGLDKATLIWHYKNALAFIMPSISEGFGQVYLEALANGCAVIGTENSMLIDLPINKVVTLIPHGNIDAIQNALETKAKDGMLSDEEKIAYRKALLQYCKLDTLAMVKILHKLRELLS